MDIYGWVLSTGRVQHNYAALHVNGSDSLFSEVHAFDFYCVLNELRFAGRLLDGWIFAAFGLWPTLLVRYFTGFLGLARWTDLTLV